MSALNVDKLIENLNDKEKTNLLFDREIIDNIDGYDVFKILETISSSDLKNFLLNNAELIKQKEISSFLTKKLINNLDESDRIKLIKNYKVLKEQYGFENYDIESFLEEIESDKEKIEIMDLYKMSKDQRINVLETCSDKLKSKVLSEDKEEFTTSQIESLIYSFGIDGLVDFLNENDSYLQEKGIKIYSIVKNLNDKKQVDLIERIEELKLSLADKRKIVASLSIEAKDNLDISKISEEYRSILDMKRYDDSVIAREDKIQIDFESDLEQYKDLDELIYVKPQELTEDERKKLLKLCEICPNLSISDELNMGVSTAQEYINGENWINIVLEGIDENWTDIQKIAYIDNAIGKKISYSPDYGTEIFDQEDARTLWKIIDSGKGVCNGISQIEQYMLKKVNIKSELIGSGKHAFLKLINIAIPTKDGEVIGNTIIDPTWNLSDHKYGAMPQNFCVNYEEIRRHDIMENGFDRCSHKNDKELADATLQLDEEYLRETFKSIGLAEKDGTFPIGNLFDNIDNYNGIGKEALEKILYSIEDYCPDFTEYINSTFNILNYVLLNSNKINFNKCVVNRVYSKEDMQKQPVLFVYADIEKEGKYFFVADKKMGKFISMDAKDFEEKFECYKKDIENHKGYKLWDDEVKEVQSIDDTNRITNKEIMELQDNER